MEERGCHRNWSNRPSAPFLQKPNQSSPPPGSLPHEAHKVPSPSATQEDNLMPKVGLVSPSSSVQASLILFHPLNPKSSLQTRGSSGQSLACPALARLPSEGNSGQSRHGPCSGMTPARQGRISSPTHMMALAVTQAIPPKQRGQVTFSLFQRSLRQWPKLVSD